MDFWWVIEVGEGGIADGELGEVANLR